MRSGSSKPHPVYLFCRHRSSDPITQQRSVINGQAISWSPPGRTRGCGYLPLGQTVSVAPSPELLECPQGILGVEQKLSLLPSPAAMMCKYAVWAEPVTKISAGEERGASPRTLHGPRPQQGGLTAAPPPGLPGSLRPSGAAESPCLLHSQGLSQHSYSHSSRISSKRLGEMRAPTLLWIHKAQGRSGESWLAPPPAPALVAGSAGNWHYSSNLQEEKVNIQPTNCFYFCYRGPWSMESGT